MNLTASTYLGDDIDQPNAEVLHGIRAAGVRHDEMRVIRVATGVATPQIFSSGHQRRS